MSYEIVKHIKINDDGVFITSCCNNVSPRTPKQWRNEHLTRMLAEDGELAVDLYLLKDYDSGNLQGGSNKYTRALENLQTVFAGEYAMFSWRNCDYDKYPFAKHEDICPICLARQSDEFDNLLDRALNYKTADKYVLSKTITNKTTGLNRVVFGKVNKRTISWKDDVKKATIFRFKQTAEDIIKSYYGSENWDITKM